MRADLSPDMTREESDRAGYVVCEQHFRPKDINSKVNPVSHRCGSCLGRQKAAHCFFLLPSISCNKVNNRSPGFLSAEMYFRLSSNTSIQFYSIYIKLNQNNSALYSMRKDATIPMSEHLATVGKKTSFLTGRTGWRRGSRPKSVCEACCLSFIHRCEFCSQGHYSPARIRQEHICC